ncbi:MAG: polysaccharide deacetylase family protein [Chloroflexota bacterium]|nr:polysaccharide deacetylase family protein [Chloroflexota bacterium]
MTATKRTHWLLMIIITVSFGSAAQESGSAHQASAVVTGTDQLEIRSCPGRACDARGTAPLGANIEITGEASDGYVSVRFGTVSGFVPSVFVATDPENPPALVAGSPACDRIAVIFNIGIGDDPATGILDTLAAKEVPATMFVMGWWAERKPPVLSRLVEEGYLIGSHGYAPNELPALSDAEVLNDLSAAEAAIAEATGRPAAPYFTPYAAAIDSRVRHLVAERGALVVGWEVPAADYGADATEESVYARVMDNISGGAIVEMHLDGPASAVSTGRALPRIIDDLRARGYQFVTIPDLLEPC